LQAAFEGTWQEGDQDRKGEDALAGKGGFVGAVRGDESRIMERFGNIRENCGMEPAKRSSYFIL
jgi:hypothetical protein